MCHKFCLIMYWLKWRVLDHFLNVVWLTCVMGKGDEVRDGLCDAGHVTHELVTYWLTFLLCLCSSHKQIAVCWCYLPLFICALCLCVRLFVHMWVCATGFTRTFGCIRSRWGQEAHTELDNVRLIWQMFDYFICDWQIWKSALFPNNELNTIPNHRLKYRLQSKT